MANTIAVCFLMVMDVSIWLHNIKIMAVLYYA